MRYRVRENQKGVQARGNRPASKRLMAARPNGRRTVLSAQETVGNQRVQQILLEREARQTADEATLESGHVMSEFYDRDSFGSRRSAAAQGLTDQPGRPLAAPVQEHWNSRFGYDFEQVRVHTGDFARAKAWDLGAAAFTSGSHIYFGQGRYAPYTMPGRRLLAHELTHVVQQESGRVASGDGFMIQCDDGAPGPRRLNLFPSYGELMEQSLGGMQAARRWLDENRITASLSGISTIVRLIRRDVPEAANLSDSEITALIRSWAEENHIPLSGAAPPEAEAPSLSESELVSRIESALGDIPTSVTIEGEEGQINITASGVEIEREMGRVTLQNSVRWSGEMGFTTSYRGLRFSGSLSQDRWRLAVSYRIGPRMPNLTELPQIFSNGWDGIRGLVETVGNVDNLDDIRSESDVISEHFSAAKTAVQTISRISAAEPGQISFGVRATAGGGLPGAATPEPASWQIQATLTIVF